MWAVRCMVPPRQAPLSGHIEQLPSGSWRVKAYAGKDPLTGRICRYPGRIMPWAALHRCPFRRLVHVQALYGLAGDLSDEVEVLIEV